MQLRSVSSEILRNKIGELVKKERAITAEVVRHLAEVLRRKLFVEWGYARPVQYLTQELKYSETSAYTRLRAAELLLEVPEVCDKIHSGDLNLSQVLKFNIAVRQEEKVTGARISTEHKREVFSEILNSTGAQTERILHKHFQEASFTKPFRVQHKSDGSIELTLNIPKECVANFERVQEVYSHLEASGDWLEIFKLMSEDVLNQRDPLRKKPKASSTQSETVTVVKVPKTLTPRLRAEVFRRDHGKCQHRHPDGSICGSKFQPEVDHITPIFAGGTNELHNLRTLCRSHNHYRYQKGAGFFESQFH